MELTEEIFRPHLVNDPIIPFLRTWQSWISQNGNFFIMEKIITQKISKKRSGKAKPPFEWVTTAFSIDVDGREQLAIVIEIYPETSEKVMDEIINALSNITFALVTVPEGNINWLKKSVVLL